MAPKDPQPAAADPEYEIPSSQVPEELLKLVTGNLEGTANFAGLVIDVTSIVSIKRYEKRGLSLPSTLGEVYALFRIESLVPGLTNQELLDMYKKIIKNCKMWSPLENNILQTSIDLDVFADTIKDKGKRSVGFLEQILKKYVNVEWPDLTPEDLLDQEKVKNLFKEMDIKDSTLDPEKDAILLNRTASTINSLVTNSDGYYARSQRLAEEINAFRNDMTLCRAEVQKKENIADSLQVNETLRHLRKERDDLKKEIATAKDNYEKNIGLSFIGVLFGLIGIAITGGIFGTKAEEERQQMNMLQAKLNETQEKIAQAEVLIKAVNIMSADLEGLNALMVHAQKGAQQLIEAWKVIVTNLEQSHSAVKTLNSTKDLMNYWLSFLDVIDPWSRIQGNARSVTEAIKKAIDETKKNASTIPAELQRRGNNFLSLEQKMHIMPMRASVIRNTSFPMVDPQLADDAYKVIFDLFTSIIEANYPDYYTYASDINMYSHQGQVQLHNSIIKVRENSRPPPSIKTLNDRISALGVQLEQTTDPDEQANLKAQIQQLDEMGDDILTRSIIKVSIDEKEILNRVIYRIESIDFQNILTRTKTKLDKRIEDSKGNVKECDEKIEEYGQKVKDLEKSLELMDKYDVFRKLGPDVPSVEEVTAIATGAPLTEIEIIQTGIKLFLDAMEEIGKLFTEESIRRAINLYKSMANTWKGDKWKYEDQLNTLQDKLEDILAMDKMTKIRLQMTAQMKQLVKCLDVYQKKLKTFVSEVIGFDRVINIMGKMENHLTF